MKNEEGYRSSHHRSLRYVVSVLSSVFLLNQFNHTRKKIMLSRFALKSPSAKILATASLSTMSLYSLTGTASNGDSISMDDFKGKVIYATNVASR